MIDLDFGQSKRLKPSFLNFELSVRLLLLCMARFVSQETVARLSGILPSQTTRSQVAKFKLDHHKMIYKEKRRMSMPGKSPKNIAYKVLTEKPVISVSKFIPLKVHGPP